LSKQQKDWLKRRTAVKPAIGHLKSDHRMDRCWLQGALGDALHSISYAAGYNLRWLMRAIARLEIGPVFLRLLQAVLSKLLLRPCEVLRYFLRLPVERWCNSDDFIGPNLYLQKGHHIVRLDAPGLNA
jgi:hypothetical protein